MLLFNNRTPVLADASGTGETGLGNGETYPKVLRDLEQSRGALAS